MGGSSALSASVCGLLIGNAVVMYATTHHREFVQRRKAQLQQLCKDKWQQLPSLVAGLTQGRTSNSTAKSKEVQVQVEQAMDEVVLKLEEQQQQQQHQEDGEECKATEPEPEGPRHDHEHEHGEEVESVDFSVRSELTEEELEDDEGKVINLMHSVADLEQKLATHDHDHELHICQLEERIKQQQALLNKQKQEIEALKRSQSLDHQELRESSPVSTKSMASVNSLSTVSSSASAPKSAPAAAPVLASARVAVPASAPASSTAKPLARAHSAQPPHSAPTSTALTVRSKHHKDEKLKLKWKRAISKVFHPHRSQSSHE